MAILADKFWENRAFHERYRHNRKVFHKIWSVIEVKWCFEQTRRQLSMRFMTAQATFKGGTAQRTKKITGLAHTHLDERLYRLS